jgi:ApbE superfamily uncharacterized protein (UPF0280 family)
MRIYDTLRCIGLFVLFGFDDMSSCCGASSGTSSVIAFGIADSVDGMIFAGSCVVLVDAVTVQLINGSLGPLDDCVIIEPALPRFDFTEQVEQVPDETDGVLVRLCVCLR